MEEGVRRQMQVPVASWGVKEVCDWAEYIGLGQYRKRFLHHCIGGSLLMDLTEHNLKVCAALLLTCKVHSHLWYMGRWSHVHMMPILSYSACQHIHVISVKSLATCVKTDDACSISGSVPAL